MTDDTIVFSKLEESDQDKPTFKDKKNGRIIAVRKVGKVLSGLIENIYLVDGLKFSLLNIS